MTRVVLRSLCATVLVALLLGCWDFREINQLALVMAVGVDKAETPGRFRVTVQIARPGSQAKATGGGAGGAGSGQPIYTATADGDTIFAAIRNMAQFTSRRIMWAHNNVIVIGEEVAREDLSPIIDFFTRNQELRMRTWVVVARGTDARSIVAAKTGMEDIPADSISALFRYAQLPGESVVTDMNEVAAAFFSDSLNPVIAALRLTRRVVPANEQGEHGAEFQAELRGTAVFRGRRLVGFVDEEPGRGVVWLREEMRNAVVTIPCPQESERNMAVEVRSPAVQVRSDVSGATPRFHVDIRSEGWLSEQDCATPHLDTAALKAYAEREFRQKIEASVRSALEVLQTELRADAVKFGQHLRNHHPDWWKRHRHEWESVFPRVQTSVSVSVRIPKMGLYTRPLNP